MDIEKELQEAKTKQQQVVARVNALEQERQQLLQEALRLDGEIRALTRLKEQGEE